MSATLGDFQLAAAAAGFTLGFGFLTVWEAWKQTRRNRNPLRSAYIYMLWGEIVVNLSIGIMGWLFLNGNIGPTVPVLFFILSFWVLQIQLLMQIIVNRIALIAEHRSTVWRLKWGTVVVITTINIAVYIIWIPSHVNPPLPIFVTINNVWDKISKVLILIVDAGLNWYFLHTVKIRLLRQNGLMKYQPLIDFNAKLMVVSIAMDGLLIGLMFLHNPVVYIQFHPVVYLVKLNIEMSMASLIVRLAQGRTEQDMDPEEFRSSSGPSRHLDGQSKKTLPQVERLQAFKMTSQAMRSEPHSRNDSDEIPGGIHRRTDLNIVVEHVDQTNLKGDGTSSRSSSDAPRSIFGDETPLHKGDTRICTKAL